MSSTCVHEVSLSLRLCSPFLLHALPTALLPFPLVLEARGQLVAHSAEREYGLVWRDLLPHRLWATASTPRRLLSSPTQSSWTRRRSSPTKGFPRTPNTMTLHSRVCFVKLTEYIAITLNEKTCLSVCRRCPTERGDLLRTERGDLLSKVTRKNSTLLNKQKEQILAECQVKINRREFQAAYDRRCLLKLELNLNEKNFIALELKKVQQRDQHLLHERLLQQNSELRQFHHKVSMKWRN